MTVKIANSIITLLIKFLTLSKKIAKIYSFGTKLLIKRRFLVDTEIRMTIKTGLQYNAKLP